MSGAGLDLEEAIRRRGDGAGREVRRLSNGRLSAGDKHFGLGIDANLDRSE